MTRERVVSIPVVVGGSGSGGGVGAMFALVGAVIAIAVLVLVAVVQTHPAPHFQPVTNCEPFCSPTTVTVATPPAEFPFGDEQR